MGPSLCAAQRRVKLHAPSPMIVQLPAMLPRPARSSVHLSPSVLPSRPSSATLRWPHRLLLHRPRSTARCLLLPLPSNSAHRLSTRRLRVPQRNLLQMPGTASSMLSRLDSPTTTALQSAMCSRARATEGLSSPPPSQHDPHTIQMAASVVRASALLAMVLSLVSRHSPTVAAQWLLCKPANVQTASIRQWLQRLGNLSSV